jgi:hypothetical protein
MALTLCALRYADSSHALLKGAIMHWQARYKNGELVTQEVDGISADRLNRQQLESFSLMFENREVFTLHLDPDQSFFYRRRTEMDQGSEVQRVCHVIGTRKGEAQSVIYIFEDGHIAMAGAFREDHPWFYSPEFLSHELQAP